MSFARIARLPCPRSHPPKSRPTCPSRPTIALAPGGLNARIDQLLAGADFNCARTTEGAVECWGTIRSAIWATLRWGSGAGLAGEAPFIGGGHLTAYALMAEGGVACWRDTSFGQLGDGTARWK
jgi:hypothetical protein